MNITFQPLNAAYRPSVTVPSKQKPRSEKIKGDYDTVNIRKAQAALEDDESFARLLAKKTAAQSGSAKALTSQTPRGLPDGSLA